MADIGVFFSKGFPPACLGHLRMFRIIMAFMCLKFCLKVSKYIVKCELNQAETKPVRKKRYIDSLKDARTKNN